MVFFSRHISYLIQREKISNTEFYEDHEEPCNKVIEYEKDLSRSVTKENR